jgi:uncharacterized membrane protein
MLYWIKFAISLAFPSVINVLLLRYVSASATERNDTNLFEAIILLVLLLSVVALLQDAIRKVWTRTDSTNIVFLIVVAANFVYFWYMYIYHIPIPGAMI